MHTQSCPAVCNPGACNLPSSYVRGIFQVRILLWVAISSSRWSSRPRDRTCVSCISWIGRWILYQLGHLKFPVCSIRKSNSTKGQNRGGRESRREKEKEKDEEEDTPREAELKWGCPPSQQEGWLMYKSVPLGLLCTDSGKRDQEATCSVASSHPASAEPSLPPTQTEGRHGRALGEGRVFSQVSDRRVSSSMQERKERTPEDLGSWRAIRLRFV